MAEQASRGSRLAYLTLHLLCLGHQDAVASPVLNFFPAEDFACAGRTPLHSFPASQDAHFLSAPDGAEAMLNSNDSAVVHFRCTGGSIIASLTSGIDLCALDSDRLYELAEGICLPAVARTITANHHDRWPNVSEAKALDSDADGGRSASHFVNIRLSEPLTLARRTGCLAGNWVATARYLAKGKGGSKEDGGGATALTKKEIPEGPGTFFGAVLLAITTGSFSILVGGLLLLNMIIGHRFVSPKGPKHEEPEQEGD